MKKRIRYVLGLGFFVACLGAGPSRAAVVDLTTSGACTPITPANLAACSINGAVFTQAFTQSTGTGVIDSFDRLQNNPIEQGMNTNASNVYDNQPGNFTHAINVNQFGVVSLLGTDYVRFLLDINESSGQDNSLLVLDKLKIVTTTTGDSFTSIEAASAAPGPDIYELNAGNTSGPNAVKLDASLNSGSGSGDMFMYVPASLFAGTGSNFLYLYSQFGNVNATIPPLASGYGASGGFEEWSRVLADGSGAGGGTPVPEPSQLLSLFAAGIPLAIGYWKRRRIAQAAS